MEEALGAACAQLRAPRTLVGMDAQQASIKSLIEAAIRDRQSTSVLCLGRPGSGKTACVNTVLAAFPIVRVVRLTGHLHAPAHIGLRETLHQLGDDTESDKKKTKSVAPEEMVPVLFARLRALASQNRPIVLVLSSFERFAAQPRQMLLYSLLELTHSAHSVVLIGVTSAFDALDQLEKRVRSRFSQRHVLFLGPQTVEDIKRIAHAALLVDGRLAGAAQWNAACETTLKAAEATTVLTQHLQHTNDVRHFLNLLVRILCVLCVCLFVRMSDTMDRIVPSQSASHSPRSLADACRNLCRRWPAHGRHAPPGVARCAIRLQGLVSALPLGGRDRAGDRVQQTAQTGHRTRQL